jgi:hypothetical protein
VKKRLFLIGEMQGKHFDPRRINWRTEEERKLYSENLHNSYTCRKISPSFVHHYKYKRWWSANRGTGRKRKGQCIRHLAPLLRFDRYHRDGGQSHRYFASSILMQLRNSVENKNFGMDGELTRIGKHPIFLFSTSRQIGHIKHESRDVKTIFRT